jgi:hypothetical protein
MNTMTDAMTEHATEYVKLWLAWLEMPPFTAESSAARAQLDAYARQHGLTMRSIPRELFTRINIAHVRKQKGYLE